MIKLFKSAAIMASEISTNISPSDLNEFCDRLNLLLPKDKLETTPT